MKATRKILGICLIALVLVLGFLLMPNQAEAASISEVNDYVSNVAGPTLVKYDGVWYYVKNGQVNNATTLCKFNGKWYYVENGRLSTKTTLVKYGGVWHYVSGGTIQNQTTLCKYNGTWFYVENGRVDFTQNSLFKFNGYWFLVQNGKVNLRTTTLYKFNGKWYYIENGKVCARTTLIKYNGIWFYVSGGTIKNATTLCFYRGQWFYVVNGKLSGATAFVKYGNDRFYVSGGTTHPELSGRVEVNGKAFYVRNGVLTECHSYGHCYANATCTEPETCYFCTVTNGVALGHSIGSDYCCEHCGEYMAEDVTIKVWTPQNDLSSGWLAEMQAQFEEAHPEYNITWINEVCHEGDAGGLVTGDVSAAGDVYMFANDQLGTLINCGGLMQLSGSFAEQVVSDNTEFMVDTVTYTDGGIYGFPMTGNTWFMYYDKSVFTEEDVKSLDTMLEKGRVCLPFNIGWTGGAFFLGCGGTVFGEKGNDASAGIQFGGENGYLAAKKMIELANNPNVYCGGMDSWQLIEGSVDAVFSGSWDYSSLKNALGDKLGVAMLPTFTADGEAYRMTALSGSKAVGVNPNADHLEASTEFAAFLASEEAQLARYELCGVIPAHNDLRSNEVIANDPVAVAEMDTLAYASVVQPSLPEMANYWTPVTTFGVNVANGEINLDNYKDQVDLLVSMLNTY